jgi:uncharacterized protein involved in outer membrane biogenesis
MFAGALSGPGSARAIFTMDRVQPAKWLGRTLIALAVIIASAAALTFFISLDDYIPQIEAELSARLREPVSIKTIRFTALPLPHVTITGITVGKADDIQLGKVRMTPDLFSLLNSTRVIRSIEIDSLVLTQKGIDKIAAWTRPDAAQLPRQPLQVRLERIRLDDARIRFAKATFGPFDARVSLDGNGEPADASIVTRDGKLKVLIKPGPSNHLIEVSARSWTLPVPPMLVFDELTAKGTATFNDASLSELRAKLYGGTASGKANIRWQKGLRLSGIVDASQVEMQKLAPLLSLGTHISGRLSGRPVFSASAPSADQLMNALRLETPFTVQSGVLHGVDLQKAATNLVKQGAAGGDTRFEQLSGHVVLERGEYRITQLKIVSGALAADGGMNISPTKELSGRIHAQVKALGASTRVPLNVAGTVDAPLLYPTAGTVAGAAVGTVMLGPGFGTSVGAKIGAWAEDLFGGKEEQKSGK